MWHDRRLRQRIVGAVVLVLLAITFLPMLFTHEVERERVRVEAPPMPVAAFPAPSVPAQPQPQLTQPPAQVVSEPSPRGPAPVASVAAGAGKNAASQEAHVDEKGLPVSWTIQLASLSNRVSAEALMQKLRSQGYTAYIRTVDGMHRIFVGPLIERTEAQQLRDQLQRQHQLNGFVVRFQPERR